MPSGPVTVFVHMASVWVPFTSESKEAIAAYPEIMKELRLGIQAVGRKLGMYLKRRNRVRQEGERRNVFMRYLGEVATAVSAITAQIATNFTDNFSKWRKKKTAEADARYDKHGKKVEESNTEFGSNVLIVDTAGRLIADRLLHPARARRHTRNGQESPAGASVLRKQTVQVRNSPSRIVRPCSRSAA